MSDAVLKDEHLAAMQEAIDQEFERSARLRKVVPEVAMPGATYGVVVPRVVPDGKSLSFKTDTLKKPVSLSVVLKVKSDQIDDLDNVLALAKGATKRICGAEDRIIAYGSALLGPKGTPEDSSLQHLHVEGLEGAQGLFHGACGAIPADEVPRSDPPVTLDKLLAWALEHARGRLENLGHMAPHAAVLGDAAWKAFRAAAYEQRKRIEAAFGTDLLVPVVGADVKRKDPAAQTYATVLAPELVNLDLARVMPPRGSLRGYDEHGNLRYVIEDKFFLRIKDEGALASLRVEWNDQQNRTWFLTK